MYQKHTIFLRKELVSFHSIYGNQKVQLIVTLMISIQAVILFRNGLLLLIINKRNQIMLLDSKLQQLLHAMENQQVHCKALRLAQKVYTINEVQLKRISPSSFLQHFKNKDFKGETHSHLIIDSQSLQASPLQQFWHPNQFKFFIWLSVCYSYTRKIQIQQFTNEDINFVAGAFPRKTTVFIEYNLCTLIRRDRNKKDSWAQEEVHLLNSIIKQEQYQGKWSDVSFALYDISQKKYFRSSHKCREKWFNHLNPVVKHGKWQLEEDLLLFQLIDKYTFKWSCISRQMNGSRTEHMVKNRYNSLYRKYIGKNHARSTIAKNIQTIIKDLNKKVDQSSKHIDQKYIKTLKCKEPMTEEIEQISTSLSHSKLAKRQTNSLQLDLGIQWQNFEMIEVEHSQNYDYEQVLKRSDKFQLIDYISMQYVPIIEHDFNLF